MTQDEVTEASMLVKVLAEMRRCLAETPELPWKIKTDKRASICFEQGDLSEELKLSGQFVSDIRDIVKERCRERLLVLGVEPDPS